MTPSTPVSEATSPTPPELPALHTTTLDAAQVEQLLGDIEACTELVEILPKYFAQGHVPDRGDVTLRDARTLLASRAVRGLQLRYRYDGADWWDTLMVAGDRYRVVRIRHDFAEDNIRLARAGTLSPCSS